MASPQVLASYKFPLTEKPITLPADKNTYQDVFNLQNTVRIILQEFVEEAPKDGKMYARKDGKWEEIV